MSDTAAEWQPAQQIDYAAIEQGRNASTLRSGLADEDSDVEEGLFGDSRPKAGEAMEAFDLNVTVEGPHHVKPLAAFSEANLHPILLENIRKCGYVKPTCIQAYCIAAVGSGIDVVAVAQTGSGKTAAYLIPIVNLLMGKVDLIGGPRVDTTAPDYSPATHKVRAEPLAIIICPTRELALQIQEETMRLAYRSKLRPTCVIGGEPMRPQIQNLSKGCDVLIGTPGRLGHLLEQGSVLSLTRVRFTIIDEADDLLNADWEEAMDKILASNDASDDADNHYMMFSATFPKEARKLAKQYLQEDYVRIRVGRSGSTHANVDQEIVWVDGKSKNDALADYLNSIEPKPSKVVIFCNSKMTVARVDDFLHNNFPCTFMHGDRTQFERNDAMREFNLMNSPILVTTDIVARGIDFEGVAVVINYDLPSTNHGGITEYVHRIGRTGRIGHRGRAVSFYNEERDGTIAEELVNLLLETNQTVPDFLEQYMPEDGKAVFHDSTDESDDEEEEQAGMATTLDEGSAWDAVVASGGGPQAPAINMPDDAW